MWLTFDKRLEDISVGIAKNLSLQELIELQGKITEKLEMVEESREKTKRPASRVEYALVRVYQDKRLRVEDVVENQYRASDHIHVWLGDEFRDALLKHLAGHKRRLNKTALLLAEELSSRLKKRRR